MKQVGSALFSVLAAALFFVWGSVIAEERDNQLRVSFLDVGQGDATFIDAPSGRQMLIDGGPDKSVLRELSDVMPWHDRTIDVVMATHPDTDHVAGLFDVLERYTVTDIFRPGIKHDAAAAQSLLLEIANEGARETLARRGQVIDLGNDTTFTVLFPDRDVSDVSPNDGSVVGLLRYGKTSFLLTGDAPDSIEEYLVSLDGEELDVDVLKVGHHGSKTSSSELFVGYASPDYAVISRGCGNRYGHPHEEVLEVYERFEIPVFDTCENGTVTFISDGEHVRLK